MAQAREQARAAPQGQVQAAPLAGCQPELPRDLHLVEDHEVLPEGLPARLDGSKIRRLALPRL